MTANQMTYPKELIELCRIESSVSDIEKQLKRMLPSEERNGAYDESEKVQQVVSIVEAAKQKRVPEFAYQVTNPCSDVASAELVKEVDELKNSLFALRSIITLLQEAFDGHSAGEVLDQMEKTAEILNPLFLRKMEIDYSVGGLISFYV